jgi:predicted homoserine dehydrogenase-like protein
LDGNLGERVARLEAELRSLANAVSELRREVIGNGRGGRSVVARLHRLEGDSAAAAVASVTLAEARAERERAEHAARGASERKWGRREKLLTVAVVVFGAPAAILLPWVNLYLNLWHRG